MRPMTDMLKSWRVSLGFCLPLTVFVGIGALEAVAADQQKARGPAPGETTIVASPTSVVTMLTTTHADGAETLDLLVVWRGKPNWFGVNGLGLRSGGNQIGTKTVLRHTYGTVTVNLEFDRSSRETTLDGTVVPLQQGANVILVDDVDGGTKRRVVEQLKIEASLRPWHNDPRVVLRRSDKLITFLQCDAALAQSKPRSFTGLCEQLQRR